MHAPLSRRALMAGVSFFACLSCPLVARAAPDELPEVVVTATRVEQPVSRVGGAVTVISGAEVEKAGARSLADALRAVPGLDVYESGGIGGYSNVTLRGASGGQTLVLVDGVRVGDPSSTGGEFDFGAFSATDIERVEVLRGPQSALYGSDAMGGVVNVITRKGAGKPKASLTLEGGSYGTLHTRAAVSGGTETLSYAFSLDGFRTDGFSRYGYRIKRIASARALAGLPTALEADRAEKSAATGRVTWRPTPGVELEIGGSGYGLFGQLDTPSAYFTDPDDRFAKARSRVGSLYARGSVESWGGALRQSVTLSGQRTERVNRLTQACYDAFFTSYDCDTRFRGDRYGATYQAEAKWGAAGTTVFGLEAMRETAKTSEKWLPLGQRAPGIDKGQTTQSLFVQHQILFGERLDLTLGGRVDRVLGAKTFVTGRATLAYLIPETGTKLRASVGTGAKAPTLYQRFSIYGDPNLKPERNVGVDAGLDQSFGDRVKLSATVFKSRYRELIDFDLFSYKYNNVARATMQGVELSGDAVLIPDVLKARASYSYLHARDETKKQFLYRRPFNKGFVGVTWNVTPRLELEARATFVGRRFDFDNQTFSRRSVPAWAKLDLSASYKVDETFTAFGRIENATNARYEEIRDYGSSGRAYYAGVKATW
jgi:vitamin B12 transporter